MISRKNTIFAAEIENKVDMTTIDLRMELAQEIQNIPDSEQLLIRAINFLQNLQPWIKVGMEPLLCQ